MDEINNNQDILIIEGIRKESLFDELNQNYITLLENEETNIMYDVLPQRFYNIKTWPHSCNLKCNYDGCGFTTTPVFVPLLINKDNSMDVHKCFCGFPCAMNYIENTSLFDSAKKWELRNNLLELYKRFHGKKPEFILPADDKDLINEYCGGKKTVKEWRIEQQKKIKMFLPI